MGVSKIIYSGEMLLDLTADNVAADSMLEGVTAHNKSGEVVTGTIKPAEEASF